MRLSFVSNGKSVSRTKSPALDQKGGSGRAFLRPGDLGQGSGLVTGKPLIVDRHFAGYAAPS